MDDKNIWINFFFIFASLQSPLWFGKELYNQSLLSQVEYNKLLSEWCHYWNGMGRRESICEDKCYLDIRGHVQDLLSENVVNQTD